MNVTTRILVTILVLPAGLQRVAAQDSLDPFVVYPAPLRNGEYRGAAGVSLTVLPRLVVEEEVRQIPTIDYRARLGLPWNLSVHGYAATNVLTSIVALGGNWNATTGPISGGVNCELAYWYGFATFDGFDVNASSWLVRPAVSLGAEFERVRLAGHAALQIVTARTTRSDGIDVSNDRNVVTGYSIGATIEQPFFGKTFALLGMTVHRSRAMYQAWLAFTTFDEYLLYPEFTFAVIH